MSYGTNGPVRQRRVRLTDEETLLVISALKARTAMLRGISLRRAQQLIARLSDGGPGNPMWRFADRHVPKTATQTAQARPAPAVGADTVPTHTRHETDGSDFRPLQG